MDTSQVFTRIQHDGVVAVLRGQFPPETAVRTADALIGAGITTIEMTTNSAEPFAAMQAVRRAFGPDAAIGMGTVLNADMARQAIDAGAEFIVSPAFDRGMVAAAQAAGILAMPGAMTPTEIVEAWQAGAGLVKLFPAGPLGIEYFNAVRGPLNHIPLMANGGTNDTNIGAFIRAGAVACGMGNWLTGDGTWPEAEIGRRAALLVSMVAAARRGEAHPPQRA